MPREYTQADREAAILLAAGAHRMMQPAPEHIGALLDVAKEGPRRRAAAPSFQEHWDSDPEDPTFDDRRGRVLWGDEWKEEF